MESNPEMVSYGPTFDEYSEKDEEPAFRFYTYSDAGNGRNNQSIYHLHYLKESMPGFEKTMIKLLDEHQLEYPYLVYIKCQSEIWVQDFSEKEEVIRTIAFKYNVVSLRPKPLLGKKKYEKGIFDFVLDYGTYYQPGKLIGL